MGPEKPSSQVEGSMPSPSCSSLVASTGSESISENPIQSISDVVSFSLCSLCSIRLNYLYPEDFHENFRKTCLKRMIEHFGLPDKVGNSMAEFVNDDEFTFLSTIKYNHKGKVFRLIEELVLLSISTGSYDARTHCLIIDVAELLGIPRDLVEMHCESIYELLLSAHYPSSKRSQFDNPSNKDKSTTSGASEEMEEADEESKKYREQRDSRRRIKKYLIIGLASLSGGAVIGLTGGLAAPIVASAFGAAMGAGGFVMSSAAAGVVGSLFGMAGAGLTASKMRKRIGDLEEFSFESLSPDHDQSSLTITIAISGWITDESEQQFSKPWRNLRHSKEQYCLRYESKYLLELSQAMDYLLSFVVSYAAQEALKYTFLAGVMAAIAWPTALISMANIIDNPWDVCIGRSAEAGKHLADVLLSRQHGRRPVSLIGFSLGARVIYFCLQELSQRGPSAEGIICDVVLLGAPVSASEDQWRPFGRIIGGRIVNGFSSSDWLLKFLYRTSSAAIRVAGLQPLCWKDRRVRNVDLTWLVGGHMDYYKKLTEILQCVNVGTLVKRNQEDEEEEDLIKSESISSEKRNISSSALTTTMDSGIERSASLQSTQLSIMGSQQSLSQSASGQLEDPLAIRTTLLAPTPSIEQQQQQQQCREKDHNNGQQEGRRLARAFGRASSGINHHHHHPRPSSLVASADCAMRRPQRLLSTRSLDHRRRARSI